MISKRNVEDGDETSRARWPCCVSLSLSLFLFVLVEVILFVRLDRAVARRVRDAGEHEALAHLIVIEEGLIRLIDLATGNDTRA